MLTTINDYLIDTTQPYTRQTKEKKNIFGIPYSSKVDYLRMYHVT